MNLNLNLQNGGRLEKEIKEVVCGLSLVKPCVLLTHTFVKMDSFIQILNHTRLQRDIRIKWQVTYMSYLQIHEFIFNLDKLTHT